MLYTDINIEFDTVDHLLRHCRPTSSRVRLNLQTFFYACSWAFTRTGNEQNYRNRE